jgi:hypothetical protein
MLEELPDPHRLYVPLHDVACGVAVRELTDAADVTTLIVDPARIAEHRGRPTVSGPAAGSPGCQARGDSARRL